MFQIDNCQDCRIKYQINFFFCYFGLKEANKQIIQPRKIIQNVCLCNKDKWNVCEGRGMICKFNMLFAGECIRLLVRYTVHCLHPTYLTRTYI